MIELEQFFQTTGQTIFSMAVAGYLLIKNTAELRKVSEILKEISEHIKQCPKKE